MLKNILLDLGGVLVTLDLSATARELTKLGISEITPEIGQLFSDYECGLYSTEAFLDQAALQSGVNSRDTLIDAWNAIIVDFPRKRLDYLKGLARTGQYRMFLISNTNALHLEKVSALLGDGGMDAFESCFERCYYSHEIGISKPDPALFKKVLTDNGLKAEESLFVDDTAMHIESAAALGIRTWHFNPGQDSILNLNLKLA